MSQTPDFFIHEKAICESKSIGSDSRVWAFSHILPDARIGKNCNICDHVFIENDVVVGDDVTIKSGVQLWDGVRLGDRVFVGPNATFTNEKRPRSKVYPAHFLQTIIEKDVSIGANATILPGLTIGTGAMIGAGAVVTKNVPPYATVVGNPAVIVGYQTLASSDKPIASVDSAKEGDLGIGGCQLVRSPVFQDMRGKLSAIEFGALPFVPQRSFLVFDVPNNKVRGEHAHKNCHQFLFAVAGRVAVVVDDGMQRKEVVLEGPGLGLHIPPMVWGIQYKFEPGTILQVFASLPYENEDYIRDYAEFKLAATRTA